MPAGIGATTVHPFIPYEELPARQRRRIVIGASLRTIATIVVVVAIYFRIPMDRAVTATTVIGLVIGVLALFAIIAWQIREIMRSEHPVVRAVEALAFAIPVYVSIQVPGPFPLGLRELSRGRAVGWLCVSCCLRRAGSDVVPGMPDPPDAPEVVGQRA